MSVLTKRQKGGLERRKALSSVPMFHEHVKVERRGDDVTTVCTQEPRGASFFERFRPRLSERRYELDTFGTFVVQQVDAQRTVMNIINAFQKRFGMSRRESEMGVVAFLKILMQRHVLSMVEQDTATE